MVQRAIVLAFLLMAGDGLCIQFSVGNAHQQTAQLIGQFLSGQHFGTGYELGGPSYGGQPSFAQPHHHSQHHQYNNGRQPNQQSAGYFYAGPQAQYSGQQTFTNGYHQYQGRPYGGSQQYPLTQLYYSNSSPGSYGGSGLSPASNIAQSATASQYPDYSHTNNNAHNLAVSAVGASANPEYNPNLAISAVGFSRDPDYSSNIATSAVGNNNNPAPERPPIASSGKSSTI